MEDSRITELFTLRDESAVSEAESKYGGYCHKLAFNILGDDADAEETVSDALFRLWQSIPPEKPKSLGAYFAKITRNTALNRIERSSAKKRGSGELPLVLDELDYCISSPHSTEAAVDARQLTALKLLLWIFTPKRQAKKGRSGFILTVKFPSCSERIPMCKRRTARY